MKTHQSLSRRSHGSRRVRSSTIKPNRSLFSFSYFHRSNRDSEIFVVFQLIGMIQHLDCVPTVASYERATADITISSLVLSRSGLMLHSPEFCTACTFHMVAPILLRHDSVTVVASLPMVTPCHLQYLLQARILGAFSVVVGKIATT